MYLNTILLLAVSSLVCAGKSTAWVENFDNLVTFGDSYTDESRLGYFISHNGTAPPAGLLLPESTATAGGGITWSRWVSNFTGAKLFDYAVSGAVCDNNIIFRFLSAINGPFPDVVYEANAFVADTQFVNATTGTNTLFTNRKPDNTVYSMWIGTNDLGNSAFLTDSSLGETTIPDYIDCVYDRLDTIYQAGGRKFVIMNAAPLQLSPLYGMPDVPGTFVTSQYWPTKNTWNITEISGKMKEFTKTVNAIYDSRTPVEVLIHHRYPGASFAVFDTNTLLTHIYNNPEQYFTPPFNVTGPFHICDAVNTSDCVNQPGTLDQYMWFDELHPSERTDQIIAGEFVRVVKGISSYATYW